MNHLDELPWLNASDLAAAGRQPPAPCAIRLEDGAELTLRRLLRVLPGKRVVGAASWGDRPVLAKLFVARGSRRHWRRERDGLNALAGAGIPTPPILAAGRLEAGGHYLLTEYLEEATTLTPERDDLLVHAARLVGLMHRRGLMQTDPHLDNFLRRGETLYVIDGDGIVQRHGGGPLGQRAALGNLALFLAQLPLSLAPLRTRLLTAYRDAEPGPDLEEETLAGLERRARERRVNDHLDKSVRDCSLFRVERRLDRFTAVVRAEADWLAPVLADPDAWMARGTTVKAGHTCTVARVNIDGHDLIIKRYNIKNSAHALSRLWRPSRAWHAWREAHRLRALGIATPAPLALIERRYGPLRGKAWLITAFAAGPNLLQHWEPHLDTGPPAAEGQAVLRLLRDLARARISHGDMKASNLLWQDGAVTLIDLDATRQHRDQRSFDRAWRRDMARFLANWPQGSALRSWLEAERLSHPPLP